MVRAYSGVLGSFALSLAILRGLWLDLHVDDVLTSALVVFFLCAAIGFCIGYGAEHVLGNWEENRFNKEMTSSGSGGR